MFYVNCGLESNLKHVVILMFQACLHSDVWSDMVLRMSNLQSKYLAVPQLAERLGFTLGGALDLIERGTLAGEKLGAATSSGCATSRHWSGSVSHAGDASGCTRGTRSRSVQKLDLFDLAAFCSDCPSLVKAR
jgi:hypothetical protein